jgi:hypothetical protein
MFDPSTVTWDTGDGAQPEQKPAVCMGITAIVEQDQ